MDYPMAGHKIKAAQDVTLYNKLTAKAKRAVTEFGGAMAATPREAGADSVLVPHPPSFFKPRTLRWPRCLLLDAFGTRETTLLLLCNDAKNKLPSREYRNVGAFRPLCACLVRRNRFCSAIY